MPHSDVVEAHGKQYRQAPAEDPETCDGCAAQGSGVLCAALPECSSRTFNVIFVEAQ